MKNKFVVSLLGLLFLFGWNLPNSYGSGFSGGGGAGTPVNGFTTSDVVNLSVNNNFTTPNTQVDFSYTNLYVGSNSTSQTSIKTVNAAVNGVNGLDTGSLANSTWYYLYAISNATGSTIQGLLSTSVGAPTYPSGFTVGRVISAFRTNASAQFLKQRQQGGFVWYEIDEGSTAVLSAGQATAFTAVGLTGFVPVISTTAYLDFIFVITSSSVNQLYSAFWRPTGSVLTVGNNPLDILSQVINNSIRVRNQIRVFTNPSQSIDYMINTTTGITSGGLYINVDGYELPFH